MSSKSVKPKNSLLIKTQTSDIIALILLEFKDTFKNLNIDTLKNDFHTVQFLMEQIEQKFSNGTLFDQSNLEAIDKNDILVQLIKGIFPNITQSEIDTIQNVVSLIIGNKLVQNETKSVYSKCIAFFSPKKSK